MDHTVTDDMVILYHAVCDTLAVQQVCVMFHLHIRHIADVQFIAQLFV